MSYFDKHPGAFRILFGLLLAYLLIIGAARVYHFASTPTDENLFTHPPSNLYLLTPIPAVVGERSGPPLSDGQIPPFTLIRSMDGKTYGSLEEFRQAAASDGSQARKIEIHHLRQNVTEAYQVLPSDLLSARIEELSPTAYVVQVTDHGASDRAGMMVGDLISRVNGQTFATIFAADSILRAGQIGKDLAYDVIRENRILTLHVTLARFGFPFPYLVALLTGILFLVSGGYIGLRRPQIRAARLLGMSFMCFGFFPLTIMTRGKEGGLIETLIGPTQVLCTFLALAFYLHSCFYFPRELTGVQKRKWILPGAYIIAALGTAATVVFETVGFGIGVLVSLVYLVVSSTIIRKQQPEGAKALARPLRLAGMATAFLALLTWYFVWFVPDTPSLDFGYIFLPAVIFLAAYGYVIGRHRLLDLDLRIRRGMQYNIVATLWLAGIIVLGIWLLISISELSPDLPHFRLTGGSIEITDEAMTPDQRSEAQGVSLILLSLVAAFTLWKTGRLGLDFISRKFHRAQYDYRRAAGELAEVMSTRLGMQSLARGIVEKLIDIMQLKRVGVLFFREQGTACCEEAHGFDGSSWKEFCVRSDQKLAEAIGQFKGEFRIDYLPAGLKEEFQKQDIQYLIPIRSKERLVGTILVGEKRSESTYLREDLEFLSSVARQASVSIENAFLYEELAEQERLKHELSIARRIQLESLPQSTPQIPGLEIAGTSIPALEVGGDYYDFLDGTGRFTIVIGDVSGKGTSAALYMAKIQGILRSLNAFGLSPGELFARTNRILWNDLEKKSFVTAFGARFETGSRRVTLARAGHLPLFYYASAMGTTSRIVPRGIGMGLSENGMFDAELEERSMEYVPGDVFLFVTDGITEGKNLDGDEFGEDRLMELLGASAPLSAGEIRDRLIEAVAAFSESTYQHDDQTVVVAKAV